MDSSSIGDMRTAADHLAELLNRIDELKSKWEASRLQLRFHLGIKPFTIPGSTDISFLSKWSDYLDETFDRTFAALVEIDGTYDIYKNFFLPVWREWQEPPNRQQSLGINRYENYLIAIDKLQELIAEAKRYLDKRIEYASKDHQAPIINYGGLHVGDNYTAGTLYGSQGPNSHADHMTVNVGSLPSNIDLQALSADLRRLSEEMNKRSSDEEHANATHAITTAAIAAEKEDSAKTLTYLKAAGKWSLNVAKDIGVKIATTALEHAFGIKS